MKKDHIKAIVDKNVVLWLNEKHWEKLLGHKKLQQVTVKNHWNYRKDGYNL